MPVATQHSPLFTSIPAPVLSNGAHLPHPNPAGKPTTRDLSGERPSVLRFSLCELRVDKRELVISGLVQRVQPRVFDLLLYLVEHRGRVVTRDELLAHVWKNAYISDSVIGRCVMKARRVIGDTDPNAPIIKTLPRTGYRFVGAISRLPNGAAKELDRDRDAACNTEIATVATLPFLNLTGRGEMVWVELGLAALLNRAIVIERAAIVTPILDVVSALDGRFDRHASITAVESISSMVGASAVITAQVHACHCGYELHYQLHRSAGGCESGQFQGSDPIQMTLELGQTLSRRLVQRDAHRTQPLADADPFTNEAFARAMRAAVDQRFQKALDYLQVCMGSDSHPFEVDIEYVVQLAAVEHPETPAKTQPVLLRAAASEDAELQAKIMQALSSYHHAQGNVKLARSLIHDALDLIELGGDAPRTAAVLLGRSEMAIADREFHLALSLGQRVLAVARTGDGDRLASQCLRQEGVIAYLRGNTGHALEVLNRSAGLSRTPRLRHADLAHTLHQLAIIHRDAGRLGDATASIDEAVDCARLAGIPRLYALVLFFQLIVHGHSGNAAVVDAAHSSLRSASLQQSRAAQFLSSLADAWLSWRAGRIDEALHRMIPIQALSGELKDFWLGFALGMNTGMAIAGARYDLARELIADIEANIHFYEGTCLQGSAEYFRAALAHAQGDRAETWRMLRAAMELSSAGIIRCNACLAATWLACEDRHLQQVSGWLEQATAWTQEHPSGIMALARHCFERGDWAAAVTHQERYVENWPNDEVTLHHRLLLTKYREALATGHRTAIPHLPHLLGLRF